jgi:hypothetical protein
MFPTAAPRPRVSRRAGAIAVGAAAILAGTATAWSAGAQAAAAGGVVHIYEVGPNTGNTDHDVLTGAFTDYGTDNQSASAPTGKMVLTRRRPLLPGRPPRPRRRPQARRLTRSPSAPPPCAAAPTPATWPWCSAWTPGGWSSRRRPSSVTGSSGSASRPATTAPTRSSRPATRCARSCCPSSRCPPGRRPCTSRRGRPRASSRSAPAMDAPRATFAPSTTRRLGSRSTSAPAKISSSALGATRAASTYARLLAWSLMRSASSAMAMV